jgi:hypothetical protein
VFSLGIGISLNIENSLTGTNKYLQLMLAAAITAQKRFSVTLETSILLTQFAGDAAAARIMQANNS